MQLSKEIFVKLKQSVPFFSTLSDGELLALLKLATSQSFADEEVVFKEGSRGDTMYIILNGTVKISKYVSKKKEDTLVELTSGACFGEMGVIDQSPRSAGATVVNGAATLLVIKENLLSEKNVLLAFKLYKNFATMLAERLRETNLKLQNAAAGDRDSSEQLKNLIKKKLEKGQSLTGANLKGADLTGVFLNDANMENAILINANFVETKCKQTNFTNARFVSSTLKSITFDNSNFQGADFTGAHFENVEFISCNLKRSNFTGAELPDAKGLAVDSSPEPDVPKEKKLPSEK